jgi:hypothetical protein
MSTKNIMVAAQLSSWRPRADKSFTITFSTGELPPQMVLELASLHSRLGVLYFCDKESLNAGEIAQLDKVDIELEKKSYAQRLRSVMFLYHKQMGGDENNFKQSYEMYMESIIRKWKEKLDI